MLGTKFSQIKPMNFWAGASLTTFNLTCGLLYLTYKDCLPLVFLSLHQGRTLTRWIIDISWALWRCLVWMSTYLVLPGSLCCCRVLGEAGSCAGMLMRHVPGLSFACPALFHHHQVLPLPSIGSLRVLLLAELN